MIDTQKNRSVSDDGIIHMTAIQHVERLSGKNAFVYLVVLCLMIVEKPESIPRADAPRNSVGRRHPPTLSQVLRDAASR